MSLPYNEVVNHLTPDLVEKLLKTLGAETIIRKDTYLITNTICHNTDGGSLKLYYYYDSHLFVCYTEDGSMNVFNFLKTYYENRGIPYDWYKDIYCVLSDLTDVSNDFIARAPQYSNLRDKYQVKNRIIELPEYSNNVMSIFSKQVPQEWLNEGIDYQSLEKYNIRYSISQNKIIIPHYDLNGRLVGIRGRALNREEIETLGKYMPVKIEGNWYSHPLSLNLYGLNLSLEGIEKSKKIVLFEGEKSVLKFNSFFPINYSAAVCGSNIHSTQLALILKFTKADEIIIAFDKEYEKANSKEGEAYFNKLHKLAKKYSQYINVSFIYDMEGKLDKKDSPIDQGKDIFLHLLERRVKVE